MIGAVFLDLRNEAWPAAVGCPDCADGGAESLEVVGADWSKRVTFDFNTEMPELQPLLDQVRALRNHLESQRPRAQQG